MNAGRLRAAARPARAAVAGARGPRRATTRAHQRRSGWWSGQVLATCAHPRRIPARHARRRSSGGRCSASGVSARFRDSRCWTETARCRRVLRSRGQWEGPGRLSAGTTARSHRVRIRSPSRVTRMCPGAEHAGLANALQHALGCTRPGPSRDADTAASHRSCRPGEPTILTTRRRGPTTGSDSLCGRGDGASLSATWADGGRRWPSAGSGRGCSLPRAEAATRRPSSPGNRRDHPAGISPAESGGSW
jgi:hypothetical protein